MSSAPVFPYPGGVAGEEPPDPTAGAPGHFAWSRWIKQFVKNLDTQKISKLSPWSDTGTVTPAFVPTKTSNGYPYAVPTDLLADWPATSQLLAEKIDATIPKTITLTTVSTDANGLAAIPPAVLGLTTITGAIATGAWTSDPTTVLMTTSRVASNQVQLQFWKASTSTGGQLARAGALTNQTVHVIAWGT